MRRTGSLFLLLFFSFSLGAHELPSGNLAVLGRIWGVVRYAHPQLGHRDVDLDGAAVRAIARVRSSHAPGTLTAAVDEMLATLRDDATFVARPCTESAAPAIDRRTRIVGEGVVYLSATSTADKRLLRDARIAVVDLRPQPGRCTAPSLPGDVVPLLVRGDVPRTLHRKVRHRGYRSQRPADAEGVFASSYTTIDPGVERGTAQTLRNVIFIVDGNSAIPPFATALAASEVASFVSVGRFPLHTAVDHCQMILPDGAVVTVRTTELVDRDGYPAEPAPMINLPATASDSETMAAALHLARPRSARRRASGVTAQRLPDYRWRADDPYAVMQFPAAEYRILAAFRIWNIVHFFYGYRELLRDWEMRFGDIISMLEQAQTRRDYDLALAGIASLVPDGHSLAAADAWMEMRGSASPPFRLLPVEEKPVVVESASASVKPGDELLRIDGRDVAARAAELARYTSAATAAARQYAVVRDLASGAPGSQSVFTFRRPDGTQYEVTLSRGTTAMPVPPQAWRILDGNIGYADLRHVEDVAAMFEAVRSTRALILDLRDVPRARHTELAARLAGERPAIGSWTRVPELVGGAFSVVDIAESIGAQDAPRYDGRVIVLVDERTEGLAEHAALVLDAVAAAKFAGTPTAGTHGETTHLVVPGNVLLRFTGSALTHADGSRLHGTGIQPDLVVPRTIRGVAEGRDEVLEAAVRMVDAM